jgi:hypothetical protein
MNTKETQSKEPSKTTSKQTQLYPKNGDCHVRIPQYEWDILTMICSLRACGINEAITWIIRTHISRVKDPALISDMLTNIGANIDDIVIYMEDIQATADELTTITMKGIQ